MGQCPAGSTADGVPQGRIVRNLVENAIRYTAHGEIRLGCHAAGDEHDAP